MIDDTHLNFISGNNKSAKGKVIELLKTFGWKQEEILAGGARSRRYTH